MAVVLVLVVMGGGTNQCEQTLVGGLMRAGLQPVLVSCVLD